MQDGGASPAEHGGAAESAGGARGGTGRPGWARVGPPGAVETAERRGDRRKGLVGGSAPQTRLLGVVRNAEGKGEARCWGVGWLLWGVGRQVREALSCPLSAPP